MPSPPALRDRGGELRARDPAHRRLHHRKLHAEQPGHAVVENLVWHARRLPQSFVRVAAVIRTLVALALLLACGRRAGRAGRSRRRARRDRAAGRQAAARGATPRRPPRRPRGRAVPGRAPAPDGPALARLLAQLRPVGRAAAAGLARRGRGGRADRVAVPRGVPRGGRIHHDLRLHRRGVAGEPGRVPARQRGRAEARARRGRAGLRGAVHSGRAEARAHDLGRRGERARGRRRARGVRAVRRARAARRCRARPRDGGGLLALGDPPERRVPRGARGARVRGQRRRGARSARSSSPPPTRLTDSFVPDQVDGIELLVDGGRRPSFLQGGFLVTMDGTRECGSADRRRRGCAACSRCAATARRSTSRSTCRCRARRRARRRSRSRTRGSSPIRVEASVPAVPFWQAVLLALAGGLVLNLMPCVLPVLAIKVFGLAELAHARRGEVARHGIAYIAGVLASMLALALVVAGLRAAGTSVGWGFQFQEPLFVAAIAAVLVVFALNLFGVFEIGLDVTRLAERELAARSARGAASSTACSRWCWRRRARRRSSAPRSASRSRARRPRSSRSSSRSASGSRCRSR